MASIKLYLLIGLGSGLGGIARHWISAWFVSRDMSGVPWATLLVNVSGSFLIGVVAALPDSRFVSEVLPRQFFTAGLLGGFTTFSAFSLQSLALLQQGKAGTAALYITASILLCLLGAWAGLLLAK